MSGEVKDEAKRLRIQNIGICSQGCGYVTDRILLQAVKVKKKFINNKKLY